MLINLDVSGDCGRVWPIKVGGQQIGYLVLTLGQLLDVAGRTGGHDERAPTLPDAPMAESVEPLTAREHDVLRLIADGLSNQAIADKLFLSIGTVKAYTSQIYGKLGVNSRTMAIVRGRQLGLVGDGVMQPVNGWPQFEMHEVRR